jgi:transketolase
MRKVDELKHVSMEVRKKLLVMIAQAKAAHIGSSLSAIEIFVACMETLQDSDSLIVSKGHAAAGYYATLVEFGILSEQDLKTYGTNGSRLFGHVTRDVSLGIPFSTGSLGHGLPYGVGLALGLKRKNREGKIFVIASDGEMNEGTTWESALLANHNGLDNLVLIVDRNGIQSIGDTESTLRLEPLDLKWRSFGWHVEEVDGHDLSSLLFALGKSVSGKPIVLIAKTIKGKGVSFMEGDNLWHYKSPNQEELKRALDELSRNK